MPKHSLFIKPLQQLEYTVELPIQFRELEFTFQVEPLIVHYPTKDVLRKLVLLRQLRYVCI